MRGAQSLRLGVELQAVLADVGQPATPTISRAARPSGRSRTRRARSARRGARARRASARDARVVRVVDDRRERAVDVEEERGAAGLRRELMQGVHGRSVRSARQRRLHARRAYCPGCREGSSSRSDWWSPRRSVWAPASPAPPRAVRRDPDDGARRRDPRARAGRRRLRDVVATAPPAATPFATGAYAYPADGSVLTATSTNASVSRRHRRDGDERRHGPRRSSAARSPPTPSSRRANADVDRDAPPTATSTGRLAQNLVALGAPVTANQTALADWGTLTLNVLNVQRTNEKRRVPGSVAAIDIRLNARSRRSSRRHGDPDRLRRGSRRTRCRPRRRRADDAPRRPRPRRRRPRRRTATTTTETATDDADSRRRPRPSRSPRPSRRPVKEPGPERHGPPPCRAAAGPLPDPAGAVAGARAAGRTSSRSSARSYGDTLRRAPRRRQLPPRRRHLRRARPADRSRSPTGPSSRSAGTKSAATGSGSATGRATLLLRAPLGVLDAGRQRRAREGRPGDRLHGQHRRRRRHADAPPLRGPSRLAALPRLRRRRRPDAVPRRRGSTSQACRSRSPPGWAPSRARAATPRRSPARSCSAVDRHLDGGRPRSRVAAARGRGVADASLVRAGRAAGSRLVPAVGVRVVP